MLFRSPNGVRLGKYLPHEYTEWIAEHVEPWTYLKFPYLKKVGWKGFVDGPESGVYMATPLSRLNAADGMATPLAQEQYEKFYATLGGKPVHHRLAIHWARLIELLYAAERWVELATDPDITSPNIRTLPTATPTEGVGIVEAPRGTLTHHYQVDERGMVTKCNLIVSTTHNNEPMNQAVRWVAERVISEKGTITEGMLNQVEIAIRAYDPCLSCATQAIGQMPLKAELYNSQGILIDECIKS